MTTRNKRNNFNKRNRIFDKIITETKHDNHKANKNLMRIFETVLANSDEEYDTVGSLEVPPEIFNQPLNRMFDDVLNQCANENSFNYSNLSVHKKSVPFNHLIQ